MPVEGVPKFNAVVLLEIESVSFAMQDVSLIAHGAFVDTRTGSTYGRTTCRRWSTETLDKLKELRVAMEQDLAALVFEGEGKKSAVALATPSGIGEHLQNGPRDAESV